MHILIYPYETTECEICGASVPESNLPEHVMADVRILRIIKANRPEWSSRECEDYLRSLCETRMGFESD